MKLTVTSGGNAGKVTVNSPFSLAQAAYCFSGQMLSYVIVIDFESTCWKDKKGAQEISK